MMTREELETGEMERFGTNGIFLAFGTTGASALVCRSETKRNGLRSSSFCFRSTRTAMKGFFSPVPKASGGGGGGGVEPPSLWVQVKQEKADKIVAASGGGSSLADLAGEVSDEEVEDELPLEECDPLAFSEDEVGSLLDSIAEFRGGVDEDAEEAFLAFARDVAGDEAAAAFVFDDDE